MKAGKIFFFSLLLILFVQSCKKEEPAQPGPGYNRYSIIGKWSCTYSAIRMDTSGVTIQGDTAYHSLDIHTYYNFTTDSTYQFYLHDTLYNYGAYSVNPTTSELAFVPSSGPALQFERISFGEFFLKTSVVNQYNPTTLSTTYYVDKYVKF